jgi:uncharacterized BrkB/YihY/UPF0761 family membrane protein
MLQSGGTPMSMLRTIVLVLPILGVFGIALYYMVFAWQIGGPSHMDAAGWTAMILGIVVTLALSAVLVTLLLRRGPDDD